MITVRYYEIDDTFFIGNSEDPDAGELEFTRAEWQEFVKAVRKKKPLTIETDEMIQRWKAMKAAAEISEFYGGEPAPPPEGVAPVTDEDLAQAESAEY